MKDPIEKLKALILNREKFSSQEYELSASVLYFLLCSECMAMCEIDGEGTLTKYKSETKIAVIPNEVEQIGSDSIQGGPYDLVLFPFELKVIYPRAFASCDGIKNVLFINPDTELSAGALDGLKADCFWFPDNLTFLPYSIADKNTSVRHFRLPGKLNFLNKGTLYVSDGDSLDIPSETTEFGNGSIILGSGMEDYVYVELVDFYLDFFDDDFPEDDHEYIYEINSRSPMPEDSVVVVRRYNTLVKSDTVEMLPPSLCCASFKYLYRYDRDILVESYELYRNLFDEYIGYMVDLISWDVSVIEFCCRHKMLSFNVYEELIERYVEEHEVELVSLLLDSRKYIEGG